MIELNIKDNGDDFISQVKDIAGMRFGRYTVIERGEDYVEPSGRHRVRWLCRCDCGIEKLVSGEALRKGKVRSCGCLQRDLLSAKQGTHRESNTPLYAIWLAMRRRCNLKTDKAYKDYGGRGISVCNEWNSSFEIFRDWSICNGYYMDCKLTLDRIDNDGNYEPSNCRWVDRVVQANNRRSCRLYTYNGETHNINEWSVIYGVPYKKLYQRLVYSKWDIERALTTP